MGLTTTKRDVTIGGGHQGNYGSLWAGRLVRQLVLGGAPNGSFCTSCDQRGPGSPLPLGAGGFGEAEAGG